MLQFSCRFDQNRSVQFWAIPFQNLHVFSETQCSRFSITQSVKLRLYWPSVIVIADCRNYTVCGPIIIRSFIVQSSCYKINLIASKNYKQLYVTAMTIYVKW